jgi:hypothetical protein
MRRMSEQESGEYYEVSALTGRLRVVVAILVGGVIAFGLVLRFWAISSLWLDEALTVNIAGLPLHEIPGRLKQDGAPPLYYYLLHFWISVFGESDHAVRALAGVFGVLTLPVAWIAAKRMGGRTVAWTAVVLLASAPFAVYYSTESRMYSLVIFLTACGIVALQRSLTKPRIGNLIAVGVVTAALLYTQYWSLYLVGVVGLWLLGTMVALRHRSPESSDWRRPLATLVAVAVGCLAFVPWLPTFFYQSKHTGTPWAAPANFAGVVNAVTGFTFNQGALSTVSSNEGRLLAVIYLGLAALAVFGVGRSSRVVELDLFGRPRLRGIAIVVVGTLFAAIAGGLLTSSAFSTRYASVIFLPFMIIVALGTSTLLSSKGRLIVLAVAVAAGLWISIESVHSQRTEAPRVATVLAAHAHTGDVIAFCPDQLGPDTYRLITNRGRYQLVTFPRGISPEFVDWVDYAKASHHGSPTAFAANLEKRAGTNHHIWLVWMGGYRTFGVKCEQIVNLLSAAPGVRSRTWIIGNGAVYYEPMNLSEFTIPAK